MQAARTSDFTHVIKRDGGLKPFDADKIAQALARAALVTQEFDAAEARRLTQYLVVPKIKVQGHVTPHIEQIQDAVEAALFDAAYPRTLRAYIVYREQHRALREDRRTAVDVERSVNEYLHRQDWRIHANANQGYSLGGLILNVSGKVIANYWLNHVYPPEVGAAHRSAALHIHDLDMLAGYCAGWSLRTLLHEGLNGVPGKVEAGAAQAHVQRGRADRQLPGHAAERVGRGAGLQLLRHLPGAVHPQGRPDYEQVRQCVQELIYNLNVPSRWGTQTPFTNLTFDWVCPEDLREQVPVVGGVEMPFTYGELQAEMDMINRAYIEVMMAGDAKGRVFTFPIPTYNITEDFDWDSAERRRHIFAMTAKYGLPYFQNFLNSELKPNMIRSMCCRLQLDLRELLKRGNGLFGSAEQTGSLGVVTINCARLGYLHQGDEAGMLAALDTLLELGRDSLEIKRKVIQRHMDNGLFPYTKRYLGTLRNHFSTLGVNGINEMIRNFTRDAFDISTDWGHAFALRLLDHIRARMLEFQDQTGNMYNLEATPAEGTTYRFAKEDARSFPDILQAGTRDMPYYTNSSQLPVGYTDDPFEALELQDDLQRKYTGGTVLHLYMTEPLSSAEACRQLVKRSLERFRLPYITVTPTFSICPSHGYLGGRHDFCPRCDEELIAQKRRALQASE